LKGFESRIAARTTCLTLSNSDLAEYQEGLGCPRVALLPAFIPDWKVEILEGMGNYCLYHGDLSVDANEKTVIWLLKKVFWILKIPLVIAGKDPSDELMELAHRYPFTCLVANPGEKEMQDMIAKAHIHVLPSLIQTGAKLKLLNALFHGRHCLVNQATIHGSDLEQACHLAESAADFREIIKTLYQQPIHSSKIGQREQLLKARFNNQKNAEQMIQWIWGND